MTISKNGAALLAMVLSLLGAKVSDTDLATTVSVLGQVISLVVMLYNQYQRGDVKNFLFKHED